MEMAWTHLGTGSPVNQGSRSLFPQPVSPCKCPAAGGRAEDVGTLWSRQKISLISIPWGTQIGQVRSISTAGAHAATYPSLPTSFLLLIGGLPAWAFYGHDMPVSVFNFHSPFGGSEIPQRWDPLIERPSVMELSDPSNVVAKFSINITVS